MFQPQITDDKSPLCIPFILSHLSTHRKAHPDRPFIIGLNGVQGIGKTTLVSALATTLREHEGLPTLVVSIDDFYLRHADQLALSAAHPDNKLVSCRGEPGTHDLPLLTSFLTSILSNKPTQIPAYDKSAHSGRGDRVAESQWQSVNTSAADPKVQVVILEGWCVGFRSLDAAEVERRWRAPGSRTLGAHALEHLLFVNEQLAAGYDRVAGLFDAFVHLDAEDTAWVYDWRLEQEAALRRERGSGMTDDQIVRFVDAYYPAYELFSDRLREGIFVDKPGRQLRLVVGKDRKVKENIVI